VLLVGGLFLARTGLLGGTQSPALDSVVVVPNQGTPAADIDLSGTQRAARPAEAVLPDKVVPSSQHPHQAPETLREPSRPTPPELPLPSRVNLERPLEAEREASRALVKARDTLLPLLNAPGGERARPSGGPRGEENGEAPRIENQRKKRLLRWTMVFNTQDGEDYLRQLRALGAILAFPKADGGYLVIRDLTHRPAQPRAEDLTKLDRIYWIDDKPESVASLSRALGIAQPAQIVALFPEKLEKELLQKELGFAGRSEDSILETRFEVVKTPKGYEAKVTAQKPNR
jgi:hypothetical protein